MSVMAEPEYFVNRRKHGQVVAKGQRDLDPVIPSVDVLSLVLEPPKFDLDAYIANYKGTYHWNPGRIENVLIMPFR